VLALWAYAAIHNTLGLIALAVTVTAYALFTEPEEGA
jgi:hypothetical protein